MYQGYTNNSDYYFRQQMENGYNDEYRVPHNNFMFHQMPPHFHGFYGMYPMPFYFNNPFFHMGFMNQFFNPYNFGHHYRLNNMPPPINQQETELKDYGPMPLVINIEKSAERNTSFRVVLWTGNHLQVTLMSLNPGEDIGVEVHPNVDQFIRIEDGQGISQMGSSKDNLTLQRNLEDGTAIMIPAGTWHNITNTGVKPLKLYSIYAPPNHPKGVIHKTKAEAEAAEMHLG